MRLLLIDDDPEIRFLAAFLLEQAGHVVVAAASGADGLRAAAADSACDGILLDWHLGDMEGTAALAALLRAAPDRPVIFVTGRDDEASARAFMRAGAVGVIPKPFDPDTFAARVAELLSGDGQEGEPG